MVVTRHQARLLDTRTQTPLIYRRLPVDDERTLRRQAHLRRLHRQPPSPPRIRRRRPPPPPVQPGRRTASIRSRRRTPAAVVEQRRPISRRRRLLREELEEEEDEESIIDAPLSPEYEPLSPEVESFIQPPPSHGTSTWYLYQFDGETVKGPFDSLAPYYNDHIIRDLDLTHRVHVEDTSQHGNRRFTVSTIIHTNVGHFIGDGSSSHNYNVVLMEVQLNNAFIDEELVGLQDEAILLNTEERRRWFKPCTNLFRLRLYRNMGLGDHARHLVGFHQTAVYRPFGRTTHSLRRVTYGWAGDDILPDSGDDMATKLQQLYHNFTRERAATDDDLFQVVFRFVAAEDRWVEEGHRASVFRTYNHRPRNNILPNFDEVLDLVQSSQSETIGRAIDVHDKSDPDYNVDHYILDLSMFIVQMMGEILTDRRLAHQREADMVMDPETSLGTGLVGGGAINEGKRKSVVAKFVDAYTYHTNKKNDCLVQNVLKYLREKNLTQLTWQHIKDYRTRILDLEPNDYCFITTEHILKIEFMFGVNIHILDDRLDVTRALSEDRSGRPVFICSTWEPHYCYHSDRSFANEITLLLFNNHYYIATGLKAIMFTEVACLPYAHGHTIPKITDEFSFLLATCDSDSRCDLIIKAHEYMRSRHEARSRSNNEVSVDNVSDEIIYGQPIELEDTPKKYKNFRTTLRANMRKNNINTNSIDDYIAPMEVLQSTHVRTIIYDFETVFDPINNNQARPYSLSWVEIEHDMITGIPKFDYDNPPEDVAWLTRCNFELGDSCCESLIQELSNFEKLPVVLVGFNSSRFDNIILLDQMLRRDLIPQVFWAQGSIMAFRWNGHTSFDVSNFLRGIKLSFACACFKTNPKKIEGFDHTIPQDMFNKGGMPELLRWSYSNFDKLHEYNCMDVLCLWT